MKQKDTPEEVQRKQELRSQFIATHYTELCEYIEQSYRSHISEMLSLNIEKDDFQNTIFKNMIVRQGFENYDASKTKSLRALIYSLCKRELIDQFRKQNNSRMTDFHGKRIQVVSISQELGESDDGSFTVGDTIPYKGVADEGVSTIIEMVPQEKIPNMSITWRDFLKMLLTYTEEKILELLKMKYYDFLLLKENLKKFFPDYVKA